MAVKLAFGDLDKLIDLPIKIPTGQPASLVCLRVL